MSPSPANQMSVVAATDGTPFDLVQFGVLGIILMLVLFGFLWAKPSVDRIIKDKERAEAQRDAMIETYEEKIIPLLADLNLRLLEITGSKPPGRTGGR